MRALPAVRDDRGFTLIEVMVTMLILMVGIAGSIALIDGANARTLVTKEREAANGLSREVIEAARSVPYRQLNPTSALTQLQAIPGLEDSTPASPAWTVTRGRQTYTVALTVCSVDDSQDQFGDKSGGNYCSGAGTGRRQQPRRLQAPDRPAVLDARWVSPRTHPARRDREQRGELHRPRDRIHRARILTGGTRRHQPGRQLAVKFIGRGRGRRLSRSGSRSTGA